MNVQLQPKTSAGKNAVVTHPSGQREVSKCRNESPLAKREVGWKQTKALMYAPCKPKVVARSKSQKPNAGKERLRMSLSRPTLTGSAASLLDDRGTSGTQSPGFTLLRSSLSGGRCIFRVLLLAPPLVERTVAPAFAFRGDGCSWGPFDLGAVMSGGASETSGSSGGTRRLKFLRIHQVGDR